MNFEMSSTSSSINVIPIAENKDANWGDFLMNKMDGKSIRTPTIQCLIWNPATSTFAPVGVSIDAIDSVIGFCWFIMRARAVSRIPSMK